MTAHRIAFSGWMASGKDTVAETVMHRLGEGNPARLSFADPIRGEVDRICRLLRSGADDHQIAAYLHCDRESAAAMRGMLADDLASGAVTDARSRTDSMRRALQIWGTDVRRSADPGYWIRASLKDAQQHLDAGRSVYYTDMRFPNEVEALRDAGFYTARISISRETQASRLRQRDGLDHRAEALLHPSETALDDYPHFHQTAPNDGELEGCVQQILAGYRAWTAGR